MEEHIALKKHLRKKASQLPALPGVYLMRDKEKSIIYVGKSKHLKVRVSSYFGESKNRPRKVERMVRQIADFDHIITDTELDALLLECDLIKKIKPLYNKLLKNDNRYRYIHLNEKGVPFWESAYERKEQGLYFGPYDMKYELQQGVDVLNKYYSLMQCKGRMDQACCIALVKGECLSPCIDGSINDTYKEQINKAIAFLKGQEEDILNYYKDQMNEAAEKLDFEAAQKYKEIWQILNRITYREKAIAWSLSQKRMVAYVPQPTGGIKVYFLMGANIIKTLSIKSKRFLKKWQLYFEQDILINTYMDKADMDRAYIIYNYLHRNSECEYIEIEK